MKPYHKRSVGMLAKRFRDLGLLLAVAAGSVSTSSTAYSQDPQSWVLKASDMQIPEDNPQTLEKIELGRKLYFEPRLSSSGTVSCNSCHNVMAGGDDGLPTSTGVRAQKGGRNAPTVWNSAFHSVQFWDGRANTLEDQAKGPITNPIEMGMKNHSLAVDRLLEIQGYREEFAKVFGGRATAKNVITIDRVAKAIASYERTLVTPNSSFDRFQMGDAKAISLEAKKGWELFQTIGCTSCHSGAVFSGPKMPIGIGFYQKFPLLPDPQLEGQYGFSQDLGRFEVTKVETDKNLFRVPTLRNVSVTAPYFHNGKVKTLEQAVKIMAKTQLGRDLGTKEARLLVSFLETLTGDFPKQSLPQLPMVKNQSQQFD